MGLVEKEKMICFCFICETQYDSSIEDCECDIGSISGGKTE